MNLFSKLQFLLLFVLFLTTLSTSGQQIVSSCGTQDSAVSAYLLKYSKIKDLTKARVANEGKLEYRLALDVNYKTFLLYNGDKELITKTAYRFIEKASAIFERDINVKLNVTSILIWDHPEPYALNQDYDYYSNVLNYWNSNRTEERDAVVSLSARGGWFYGGYRMCSSNLPEPNNPELEVDLLCHELGHTLGSPHTHSCSWPGGPIDRCTNVEGTASDCQDGYLESVNGSLMSYCRSVLSFHPLCQNLMRDYSEGKIDNSFKLRNLSTKPNNPESISIITSGENSINTPSFTWQSIFGADQYHFQIAKDQAFTQIAEDTLITQSFFQSAGLNEGNYFARVNTQNTGGVGGWSPAFSFTILPWSSNSTPPLLYKATLDNDGIISGYFRKYTGTESYQIEIQNMYEQDQVSSFDLKITSQAIQSFQVSLMGSLQSKYGVRLRVKNNGVWSKWSAYKILSAVWNNTIASQTNLIKTSGNPIIATSTLMPTYHTKEVIQSIEIATDVTFKNIVFKDSLSGNGMNEWITNKGVFYPTLKENTSYNVRTRVNWNPGSYTKWKTSSLATGQLDSRFEYLGNVSKNLSSINYDYGISWQNRFYNAGNKLFVFEPNTGYYSTTDLKIWKGYTVGTTNGKSHNRISFFGASTKGDVFTLDQNYTLVKNSGDNYQSYHASQGFYVDGNSTIQVTENEGIFFKTASLGVGQFKNGNWKFFGNEVLNSGIAISLGKNSDDRIWAVMSGGSVWSFKNDNWKAEPYLQTWQGTNGIAFDNNKICYAYGDWGVARLNQNQNNWEIIPSLSAFPIQKIVFDKQNQMWLSAHRSAGNNNYIHALIKYKDQKASIYSDGLNFLNEPFDIEIFNDKLLILTTGGEVHSFDETKIQRFEAKSNYCAGEEISVTITSNSSFLKENKTSFLLSSTKKDTIISLTSLQQTGNNIRTKLPENLPQDLYRLSTMTTHPEVHSNESNAFEVRAGVSAKITLKENTKFKTTLTANQGIGLTYQWQLDGTDILNENNSSLQVNQSGNYSVIIGNQGTCKSTSAVFPVELDQPNEITLLQNSPNPAVNQTEIAFYLPKKENVILNLFNILGQKIGLLSQGDFSKGWHIVPVDSNKLTSGIYIYQLETEKFTKSIKMIK